MHEWKPEYLKLLRHCLEVEKLTAQQAANRLNNTFGTGFTRKAIIGKAWREGYTYTHGMKRYSTARKPPPPKPEVTPKEKRRMRRDASVPKLEPKPDMNATPDNTWQALPNSRPLPLVELQTGMCKWPLDGGHYCGAHAYTEEEPYSAYCKPHRKVAYRKDLTYPNKHSKLISSIGRAKQPARRFEFRHKF